MKEAILIGGKFHRQRIKIEYHQYTIRIPHMSEISLDQMDIPNLEEIKYQQYKAVGSIFGEYGVIPDNVYLEESIDPVNFIRNLVLDYVR